MPEVFERPEAQRMLMTSHSLKGVRSFAGEIDSFVPPELSPPPAYNQDGKRILQELGLNEKDIQTQYSFF